MKMKTIWKLQIVQNVAAVLGTPQFIQVTPLLHEQLWLPVAFWIQLKMLVTSFKALHNIGLGDCLSLRVSVHPTRLDGRDVKCYLIGPQRHAFSVAAPAF